MCISGHLHVVWHRSVCFHFSLVLLCVRCRVWSSEPLDSEPILFPQSSNRKQTGGGFGIKIAAKICYYPKHFQLRVWVCVYSPASCHTTESTTNKMRPLWPYGEFCLWLKCSFCTLALCVTSLVLYNLIKISISCLGTKNLIRKRRNESLLTIFAKKTHVWNVSLHGCC